MSRRRRLQGFAYNIAQKFTTSSEHFAYQAYQNREPLVTIDLVTGRISPALFDIERNRILVGQCMETLEHIVTKVFPVTLETATLVARFGLEIVKEERGWSFISAAYTVTLVDASGIEASGHVDRPEQFICP